MKPFFIAVKNLKTIFRDLKSNGIVFLLPIVFIGVFALAFGRPQSQITFSLAVVKDSNYAGSLANKIVDFLPENILNSEDKPLFKITEFSELTLAEEQIKNGRQTILLQAVDQEKIILKGDQTNPYFTAANAVLTDLAAQFNGLNTDFVVSESIQAELERFSGFDLLAPGLIIYGILILIPQIAANMAELKEKKTIFRYFTSQAKAKDIFLGYLISQTVLAVIQTAILFFAAVAFGFKPEGSIITALLITIPTNFFAVGVGLLIGGFTSKESSASNLGTMVSIVLGFFSGSFISGVQNILVLGEINGVALRVVDILPTFQATEALKSILLYGNGIESVLPQLGFILASGLIVLVIGVLVYKEKQMKRLG